MTYDLTIAKPRSKAYDRCAHYAWAQPPQVPMDLVEDNLEVGSLRRDRRFCFAPVTRVCRECGRTFTTRRKLRLYCRPACRAANRARRDADRYAARKAKESL